VYKYRRRSDIARRDGDVIHLFYILLLLLSYYRRPGARRGAKRINDARTCNNNWTCVVSSPRSRFAVVHHSISARLCVQLAAPTDQNNIASPTRSGSLEIYLLYSFNPFPPRRRGPVIGRHDIFYVSAAAAVCAPQRVRVCCIV